jgi:hypothetical protein
LDKLTDIAKGIERLRTASNEIGEARYAAICDGVPRLVEGRHGG